MYIHRIPNHLETEDKFILNLSMRQCVILFVALCMSYALFNDLFNAIPDAGSGLVLALAGALLVFLAGVALALLRIHSRGVDEWALVLFMYSTQPKRYLWHFKELDTYELLDLYHLVKGMPKTSEKEEEDEW